VERGAFAVIRTRSLAKRYGSLAAVDGIDLEVRPGEIYGFLGPNGAGKSTTIGMLLGTILPSAGSMTLFGEAYSSSRLDLRARIGVVPEHHPRGAWRWMTARDYLGFFAELYGVRDSGSRISRLLERVDLAGVSRRHVSAFSRGMLQKLSFARALLHEPDLLLLDEPISGLDPIGIKQVRDLILEQHRAGKTVLISSHQLSEMERLCGRVGIISRGRLVAQGSLESLFASVGDEVEIRVELEGVSPELLRKAEELAFARSISSEGATLVVRVGRDRDYRKDIGEFLIRSRLVPLGMKERAPSLEEAFVTITQEAVEALATGGAAEGGAT
jgi:ABC-type multidrug transport system ATPase subunit